MKPALLLSVAVCLLAAPAAARPDQALPFEETRAPAAKHFAEVLVLHATNSKKGIDRRIGDLPELTKPPFSSYDSYALLDKARLPLEQGTPRRLVLPNRRVLEVRLLESLADGRVRLSASIDQPGGKEFLPLLEVKARRGQRFIVAGQSYKSGILVLVMRVVG